MIYVASMTSLLLESKWLSVWSLKFKKYHVVNLEKEALIKSEVSYQSHGWRYLIYAAIKRLSNYADYIEARNKLCYIITGGTNYHIILFTNSNMLKQNWCEIIKMKILISMFIINKNE